MRNRRMLRYKTTRWFEREAYRESYREHFYQVRIDSLTGSSVFKTERDKFFFLSKVMETLSKTESLLDIASIKFTRYGVNLILAANFNYTVTEVRKHMNVALNNYVVSTTNSTAMLTNGTLSMWVGDAKEGWLRRGAFNASVPKAHLVIVCGRNGKLAFPDGKAMLFYIQTMRLMQQNLPVEVVAYSITYNSAYFVLMSMDQSEVSLRRYVAAVNREYVKYYNMAERFKTFTPVGNLFNPTLYVKEIKEPTKRSERKMQTYPAIFDYIAKVHAQPVVQGLASSYGAYLYSSYNYFFRSGDSSILNSMDMLAIYLKLNTPRNLAYYSVDNPVALASQYQRFTDDYTSAHNKQPAIILDRFIIQRRDIFECVRDHALATYKVLLVRRMPPELFAKVVAEINELGDFTFETICRKMVVTPRQRYNLLVLTAYEMAVYRKASYDDILRRLDVMPFGNQLIFDLIITICEEKGYSYDYIMQLLELAYPNIELCKGLFEYARQTRGYATQHLIRMFGLYDRGLIDPLLLAERAVTARSRKLAKNDAAKAQKKCCCKKCAKKSAKKSAAKA